MKNMNKDSPGKDDRMELSSRNIRQKDGFGDNRCVD